MAGQNRIVSESFVASGDLSGLQHRFVDLVAAEVVGHSLADGGIGVLTNKPQDGEHATVALQGRVRVQAGAAITVGDYITSAATGFAATHNTSTQIASGGVLTSKVIMGRALETVASGSVFALELRPQITAVQSI